MSISHIPIGRRKRAVDYSNQGERRQSPRRRRPAAAPSLSFRAFVTTARQTDDPTGDLIGDLRDDRLLPDNFKTTDELRALMRLRWACPEAHAAVPEVWKRYRAWQRHMRLEQLAEVARQLVKLAGEVVDLSVVDVIWIGHCHVGARYIDGSDAQLVQYREVVQ